MKIGTLLSIAGVLLTCAGALLFAYELFRPFNGNAYGGLTADNDDGFARPTTEFIKWEAAKIVWFRIGAVLVVVGSGLQLLGSYVSR